jgi:hypothetical protein
LNEQSNLKGTLSRAKWCSAAILWCCAVLVPTYALSADTPKLPKVAVFDFELEDESASGLPSGERPADISVLSEVTRNARKSLADSGKYALIDTSGVEAEAVRARSLRNCDGCEANIALQLGAELSLVGVVRKVEQAAYAVEIQIRDARTGTVVFGQRGVFLGGATEWSSGVRSLLRHELLSGQWTWKGVGDAGSESDAAWSFEAAASGTNP